MKNVSGALRPVVPPAEARPLFQVGDRFPYKGVWFEVVEIIEPNELRLKSIGLTAKAKKLRGV